MDAHQVCVERIALMKNFAEAASNQARAAFALSDATNQVSHAHYDVLLEDLLLVQAEAAYAQKAYEEHCLQHGCKLTAAVRNQN